MPHINKQMLSFFLTTKCNLRCIYCYNSKERAALQEQTLPLGIAKAGIDYYFATNSSRHIRFYGPGEPTVEFELMKEIVTYARDKAADRLTVEIQTNGCFSKYIREWILDNINILWVSFDGEPEIQNVNRPFAGGKPSSPVIEENARWLIENTTTHNLMVGARVTITDINVAKQKQIVDYFHSLGIRYIWTDPLFHTVDKVPVSEDKNKQASFHFNMDAYVDNYVEAFRYAQGKNIFYGSILACNFDGKCTKHCRACIPALHLTPDGYVSACDMVTFGKNAHHMDCFVYGQWNSDTQSFEFDGKKIKALQNRSIENIEHCKDCVTSGYCGGYCLGEVVNETGSLYGQKDGACKAIQRLFNEIGVQNEYPFLHP